MNKITFCIASAKNEKEYTKLLLKSLKDNTNINNHEILIFIDSDNQNTYESLVKIKTNELPNIRIFRNTNKFPIGSQRNVSLMFNAASNDVVCYLQSDMVVGKDFDKHISDTIIWPQLKNKISKYAPFINYNETKMKLTLKELL